MTREQIEKAAKEAVQDYFPCNGRYPCEERNYCVFCNGYKCAFECDEYCNADDFNGGFIAGAKWRINSVWYDASEIPDLSQDILIIFKNEICTILIGAVHTLSELKHYDYTNWAYVSDLLPERKEETNGGR